MCGIFGMITKKTDVPVAKLIREGLERLEYRGYDSAGVALVNNGKLEVYKEKGNGFLEAVYQECLSIELGDRQIPFEEKPRLHLEYKGRPLKQEYEADFLCFGEIILEIKILRRICG